MNTLTVYNVINKSTDLVLEVGEATVSLNEQDLNIMVSFPEKYTMDDQVWDETGNHLISQPIDYVFKEDAAELELDISLPEIKDINDLVGREFTISADIEDDATNLYIASTHYATFDNTISISKQHNEYLLTWTGFLPDINYHDFYKSMEQRFAFTLITTCTLK